VEQYQRTGFAMKPNHSTALPRYIISYAVDTVRTPADANPLSFHHTFQSATAIIGRLAGRKIVGRKEYTFNDKNDLWQLLSDTTRINYTTWVISRNCLRDLVVSGFSEAFERGEVTIDKPRSRRDKRSNLGNPSDYTGLCVIESPPTIVGCRIGSTQGRVVFVDSMNWFPQSIQQLATTTGISDTAIIYGQQSASINLNASNHTAEIVFRAFTSLIAWVRDNDFGQFRYTTAAQALSAYRHRFMRRKILVHDNASIKTVERAGYFGGRTEVFRLGNIRGIVYQLDCNSLFPAVMRCSRVPYSLKRYEIRTEPLEVRPEIEWSESIAEVELQTDRPIYPCRTAKYIIYPVGIFRTVLVGPELHYAIIYGHVRKVGTWAEYSCAALFQDYVEYLYKLRYQYAADGNKLYEQFTKRLMNSLYGKFAQMSPPWQEHKGRMDMLPWTTARHYNGVTHEYEYYRAFGWQVQKLMPRVELPRTFVAVSAFITSYARMRMNLLRAIAGKRDVYYQGVDGMIVSRDGFDRLDKADEIDNRKLGKLRLDAIADDCDIVGCSDYRVGGKVVLAGRAAMYDDIDTGKMLQHKFAAASHLFKGGAVDYYEEKLEEFARHGTYTKGIVSQDGWVEPLLLGEDGCTGSGGALPESAASAAIV
jgi:hypothetical protein